MQGAHAMELRGPHLRQELPRLDTDRDHQERYAGCHGGDADTVPRPFGQAREVTRFANPSTLGYPSHGVGAAGRVIQSRGKTVSGTLSATALNESRARCA